MKKFIFTIIALLGTLIPTSALAQEGAYNEAYAVLKYESENDAYLTMYYDDKKASHAEEGVVVGINELAESPDLIQARRTLHSVIFDQSFADCDTIKSTKGWFAYCMELRTISGLEYLNTSEVTDMDIMFMECSSLESLDLSHFNTSKVTTMSNMFFMNSSLQTLDLSSFDTSNVTDMSSMFANCYSLTTIYVGSYWSTASVTESDGMFSGCSSLVGGAGTTFSEDHTDKAYAHIDRADQPGYLTYGQSGGKGEAEPYAVLSEDKSTLTFYYDDQKTARNGMDVGPFKSNTSRGWHGDVSKITSVIFDVSFAECSSITSTKYWFEGLHSLTSITGIYYLHTSNVTDMGNMFLGCYALDGLDVGMFVTSNVTNMRNMFGNCSSITMLDLSGFDTSKVTDFSYMFEGCSKLEYLNLGFMNTNSATEMQNMFKDCSSLTSLDVSSFNTSNIEYLAYMFWGCSSLTSLDVSNFDTSKATYMASLFRECTSLTSLDLTNFNTANVTNMEGMFMNSSSLVTIKVGNGWSTSNVVGSGNMFEGCSNIVGGNGTTYDADHTDSSYARIDAEGAPGYFTRGGIEQVATPTWEFKDNLLALLTKTADATIFYAIANWDDESKTDSIAKALEVSTSSSVYSKPIEVTDNIVIKMMATKDGMENSKDTTFIYAYKLWYELYEVIRYGVDIADKATDNPKVEQSLVEELRWALNEGDHMYQMRAEVSSREAEYFIQAIMEACKKIEEQMTPDEQVATPTFSFNGDSLIISCATEDALIWYQSAEIDSTFVDGWAQYTAPMFVGDIKINAKATKEGMLDSEIASMVYYYTEWQELIETTYICDKVLSEILQSKPSENITKMIDDVYVELAYVRDEYEGHRLEWDRDKIEDEIMKLKHVVAEIEEEWKKESSEATYENLTLTVGGANTMATALEMVGGRAEVTKDIAAIVWNSTEPLTKSDLEGFDNPNMLIFVNEASMAPEGVENVVVDGKAKTITLVDTDSINNNFYAPQEFTAESISYTREFKQTTQKDVSRGWEGICLPFTVQSYMHESHGAIAPFRNDNSEFHFWLHQMTEQGMATATNIEANMPYIISMPNNISYPATYNQAGKVTFSAKNAVVPVSVPSMIHLADGSIGIAGVYNSLSKMEGFYALNVGDDMDEYPEGSVFVNNYRTIRPFEVYSYHADRSAGTRSIISVASLFTGGVDGATGILDATDKQDSDEVKVYSVNGILLKKGNRNEVMNSLPKGLYIIGNQKIMVK